MEVSVQEKISRFIVENFLYGQNAEQLDPTMSLLESGVVDSTGVLELVGFLEQEFGLSVPDRDLVPENFETVLRLTTYIVNRHAEPKA